MEGRQGLKLQNVHSADPFKVIIKLVLDITALSYPALSFSRICSLVTGNYYFFESAHLLSRCGVVGKPLAL